MKNKILLLLITFSCVVLTCFGCSGDSMSKYYGVWEAWTYNDGGKMIFTLEQNGKGSKYTSGYDDSSPDEIRWTIKNENKKVICEVTTFKNPEFLRKWREESPELPISDSDTTEYDFTKFPTVVHIETGNKFTWKKVN